MTPDEIAKSYNQIADRWNSEEFHRSNGIAQHERAIAFSKKRGNALDIGCGSSGRIIDLLIGHGYTADGLDVSDRMIELAKKRHPNTKFYLTDIKDWDFTKKYDFISAWDSIWHLPLVDQEMVLSKILRGLTSGGICIFTTGGLDAPEEKTDSAMGPPMYYSVLGIPETLQVLEKNECICRHLEYDQYPESHLYIIAQRT